jgi:hypothetical protein
VFGRLDYPHDLSHDLSERTVYIPSASLCCYDQQRAIIASTRDVLVAESLTKDSLLAAIQQRLSGMSNIINHKGSFLPAFRDAFLEVFTETTCRKAFEASGLVPINAQVVLDRLKVRLRTPPAPLLHETP